MKVSVILKPIIKCAKLAYKSKLKALTKVVTNRTKLLLNFWKASNN